MHYIEAFPADTLFPLVKKYLVSYSSPSSPFVLPVIPGGNIYLMYTYAQSSRIMYKNHQQGVKTCLAVGGHIFRERIEVHCSGYVEFIFAELHPIALYYLYKIPLYQFTDCFTPIEQKPEMEQTEKIFEAPNLHVRLNLFKNFLKFRLSIHQILKDPIFLLTQWIEQRGGLVKVTEMSEMLGMSDRQMERVFLEKIGVTPKYYAKLIQMRQAVNGIMTGDKQTADIVYDHGYYDAAHFNKDFRRFLGMNPTEFVQKEAPLLRHLLRSEILQNAY